MKEGKGKKSKDAKVFKSLVDKISFGSYGGHGLCRRDEEDIFNKRGVKFIA